MTDFQENLQGFKGMWGSHYLSPHCLGPHYLCPHYPFAFTYGATLLRNLIENFPAVVGITSVDPTFSYNLVCICHFLPLWCCCISTNPF